MIVDIIVGLVIAYGFYIGYQSGLIKTLFSSASLLIAIIASLKLYGILGGILESLLNLNSVISFIIGFVLTFIIVLALIRFIGNKLTDFLEKININFINQIAGGAFMSLFLAIILSYGLYFMSNMKLLSEDQQQASITYPLLKTLPKKTEPILNVLKPIFSEFYTMMVNAMDQINDKAKGIEEEPVIEPLEDGLQNG